MRVRRQEGAGSIWSRYFQCRNIGYKGPVAGRSGHGQEGWSLRGRSDIREAGRGQITSGLEGQHMEFGLFLSKFRSHQKTVSTFSQKEKPLPTWEPQRVPMLLTDSRTCSTCSQNAGPAPSTGRVPAGMKGKRRNANPRASLPPSPGHHCPRQVNLSPPRSLSALDLCFHHISYWSRWFPTKKERRHHLLPFSPP